MNKFTSIVLAGFLSGPTIAPAQDKTEPAKARPKATALRLEVVLSRYQGDRKIASRPYSFATSTSKQLSLRQGTEVPIPVTTVEKEGGKDLTSFQYKNVGANMEFTTEATDDGGFLLFYAFEDSTLWDEKSGAKPGTPIAPAFNTFVMKGQLWLRDGQTASSTTTHPMTGEVTKLEITLNVVK
jgi:Flp pilus assembly secretin CpaC